MKFITSLTRVRLFVFFLFAIASLPSEGAVANFDEADQWQPYFNGSGASIANTDFPKGFDVSFVSTASGSNFGAGYTSTFSMVGDFTVDVNYVLITWPDGNGVRVGISIDPWYGANRASQPFVNLGPDEAYAFSAGDETYAVETTDARGTLRLVRKGTAFSGYYLDEDSGWTLIGSGSVYEESYQISVGAWSHDQFFGDTSAVARLRNLSYTPEALISPNDPGVPVPEPSTWIAGAILLVPFGFECLRRMGHQARRL